MQRSTRLIAGAISILVISLMALWWNDRLSEGANVIAGDLNRPTPTINGGSPLEPAGSPDPISHMPGVEAIPAMVPPDGSGLAQATFSEDDVRAYLEANPPFDWDPTTPRPGIVSIQFLVARDAEAVIGRAVPRDAEDLLCIVTLRGVFIPRLPPDVTPVATDAMSTVVVIFDAITGNLLGQGYIREP